MGLELQRVRLQRVGREPFLHAGVRQWETNLKDGRGKGDDSLTGLVKQLGDDIVSGISDTVKTTVKGAVDDALKGWNWVSGGDGKGNIFQKAGQGIKDGATGLWKWLTGSK